MLFYSRHHIGEYGRTSRTVDREKIGKARHAQSQKVRSSRGPLILQFQGVSTPDINVEQSAGHGVKTCGEHQSVEFVILPMGTKTVRDDGLDGRTRDVYQSYVRPVKRLIVARIQTQSLPTNDNLWREQLSNSRVFDDFLDFGGGKIRSSLIGVGVVEEIVKSC